MHTFLKPLSFPVGQDSQKMTISQQTKVFTVQEALNISDCNKIRKMLWNLQVLKVSSVLNEMLGLRMAVPFAVIAMAVMGYVAEAVKLCPKCGDMTVPYPLSTQSNCGKTDYKVYCSSEELQFRSENGSSYRILSINPSSMRLVLEPPRMIAGTCMSEDMKFRGLHLNRSQPFNITSTNTVMMFNCSESLLSAPLNCGSRSPCRSYIAEVDSANPCYSSAICCTFTAGGSATKYDIRAHTAGCTAYTSVTHYDASVPASKWNYGIEVQWAAPRQPLCKTQSDCITQSYSTCEADANTPGKSRCFCIDPYVWDPVNGNCTKDTCENSGTCNSTDRNALVLGLLVGLAAAIIGVLLVLYLYRKKLLQMQRQAKLTKDRAAILSNGGVLAAKLFTKKQINKATKGFSKDLLLGRGGFGDVYKAVLDDGTVVAVKTAQVGNVKGTKQVLNEVRILSQVNHKNLVKLLGCCVDTERPLMVYEYVPNGTLYQHLHTQNPTFLDWNNRLKICIQTAEALAYLHSSAHSPIYHRDVKSTNILLDEQLNAKVSDFGLSRLAEPGMSHVSTCAQGTIGYLDPEYYRNYQLTDKSDVYSFGVVLLEVVTSMKALDFRRDPDYVNLVVFVQTKAEQQLLMEMVDERLIKENDGNVESIRAVLNLALGCLHEKRSERPSMREVSEELNYITGIQRYQGGFESSSDSEVIRLLVSTPQAALSR